MWLSLAVYMISVSRNWQILWRVLHRNKIYFGEPRQHGPEVVAHRNVCSWSTSDLHIGPCALNRQGGSTSITQGLEANQTNVSKSGDWHHQCSASALYGAGMKVALVKAGLTTALPGPSRTSIPAERPAPLGMYEPINSACKIFLTG